MRPNIFENAEALLSFINSLPVPPGRAKWSDDKMIDAKSVLNKIKVLVPDMFRYKEVLAKAAGGLGSLKSIRRFSEAAGENVFIECHQAYELAMEELSSEITKLTLWGVSEETVAKLESVKSQVAQVMYVRDSISKFKDKLQERMQKVEEAAEAMSEALIKLISKNKDLSISPALANAKAKLREDLKEVQDLMTTMNDYCHLQFLYNSILIGAMDSRAA